MKKNVAALVLAIIGAVFGLIGGILWSACAEAVSEVSGDSTSIIYLVCFIVLGIGGAVLALVGGIQAFNYKKGAFALTLVGLLFQVGCLVAACVAVSGFSFLLNLCTIVSIILLIVAVIFAHRKQPYTEQTNE